MSLKQNTEEEEMKYTELNMLEWQKPQVAPEMVWVAVGVKRKDTTLAFSNIFQDQGDSPGLNFIQTLHDFPASKSHPA